MNFLYSPTALDSLAAATKWYDTTIGKWIAAAMMVVGGIIVVFGIFKAIASFMKGEIGKGVKVILLMAVVAALFMNPALIDSLISAVGGVLDKLFTSTQEIKGGSTTGGGAAG